MDGDGGVALEVVVVGGDVWAEGAAEVFYLVKPVPVEVVGVGEVGGGEEVEDQHFGAGVVEAAEGGLERGGGEGVEGAAADDDL